MLPTSRCLGSIAQDLSVISRSRRSSSERCKDVLFLTEINASRATERARSYSASVEVLDTAQTHTPVEGPQGHATSRWEADSASPTEGHRFGNVSQSIPGARIDTALFARSTPQLSLASQQTRSFHTSPHASYDTTSYTGANVPDFFVKYKHRRASLTTGSGAHESKHEILGLMPTLADSIVAGDVVANTRRLKAKIPVEHQVPEGHIVHPSGFVVPGPGHTSTSDVARAKERERDENKDRAVQTAAIAHRVLESNFERVDATTLPSLHKVPFEVHEPDGTVKHPSGFVPPTPDHKFRHPVNMIRSCKVSAARPKARQASPGRAVLRAMHTDSTPKAF